MRLDYSAYKEKIEEYYFGMILNKNIEYYKTNGVGPYEYNGRSHKRVLPYLDAGYWQKYQEWLYTEFAVSLDFKVLCFNSEKEATMFILRWSA